MWGHPAGLDSLAPQPHNEHPPGAVGRKAGWGGRGKAWSANLKICTVNWRQWRDRRRAGLFHHEIMAPRSKPALLGLASCLA